MKNANTPIAMIKSITLYAPEYDNLARPYTKRVFLAGSIEMDVAEQWQSKVIQCFCDDVIFYNPRRENWDSSWKQDRNNPHFWQQVVWELDHLKRADIIYMYFDPDTKSPISLLELGLHAKSKKMIVCCPDGFWRKGNVDVVCEYYKIPVYTDFATSLCALKRSLAI